MVVVPPVISEHVLSVTAAFTVIFVVVFGVNDDAQYFTSYILCLDGIDQKYVVLGRDSTYASTASESFTLLHAIYQLRGQRMQRFCVEGQHQLKIRMRKMLWQTVSVIVHPGLFVVNRYDEVAGHSLATQEPPVPEGKYPCGKLNMIK